jgi:8-oxo-dGTP pyrophosphatase MutT (NUDIX family)
MNGEAKTPEPTTPGNAGSMEELILRGAAVLVPLVRGENGPALLMEVRSMNVWQPGEICFPGGRIEENETEEGAAVRETSEELLIPREKIEVIAPMHTMTGPGGAKISSCLGILHDYEGTYSKQEVERVFCVPLSWFASHKPRISDASMVVKTPEDFPYELLPGGENYPWHSIPRRFYFYETDGGVIWGITAQLLYHCLKVILKDDTEMTSVDQQDRESRP